MLAPIDFVSPHTAIFLFLTLPIAALCLVVRSTLGGHRSRRILPSTSLESLGMDMDKEVVGPESALPRGWPQTWICVGHRGRFVKSGDYLALDLAGFRIFLILSKDGVVRAFHNVCRHRAFPITRKTSGTSTVLACQYHGWTYNTLGQLTNAPHFDQLPGFAKSPNGLFAIHTKTDSRGFVHVNLSGSLEAGDSKVEDAEITGRPVHINGCARLIYSWEGKGQFNWKIVGGASPRATFVNVPARGLLAQALAACGLVSTTTGQLQFFPLTTVHTKVGSPFWYQIVYSPESPQKTTVRCDVYTTQKTDPLWRFEDEAKFHLENHLQLMLKSYENTYSELSNFVPNSPRDGRSLLCQAITCTNTKLEW
ncbi:iron-sulfur cluster-binding protein [Grosmannia clavigera kw1407]|uniref:Iron-sulfur cluster-binding protein n=1 Tax=Grosmannia clavigera (strain kw1407 / UAMH 11150) TaxID=655863 RepID=F0XEU6_GROCL|nr:iron-sulfur cluster-binding protein [Grosmannia clavigera kw1407]EFX04302.1 iron-sulfur cluster-binding protein [Grosmannia clavigera kw1407]